MFATKPEENKLCQEPEVWYNGKHHGRLGETSSYSVRDLD